MLSLHKYSGMDQCISCSNRPDEVDIQRSPHILVYNLVEFLCIPEDTCKQPDYSPRDIYCLVHRVMVSMDLMEFLKMNNQMSNLLFKLYSNINITYIMKLTCRFSYFACKVWISRVFWRTSAYWNVLLDVTDG